MKENSMFSFQSLSKVLDDRVKIPVNIPFNQSDIFEISYYLTVKE